MKKIHFRFKDWTIIIVPVLLSFLLYQKKQVTVYLIGDSTVCLFGPAQSPLTGWGMPFANFFDTSVIVKDKAESGASTRTFIEEKLWKPVEDSLRQGDYLLIQFGHNDEVQTKDSYTTEKDFKANLIRFINAARNKKANPVLITSVARRKFDDSAHIQETHEPYAGFVRNVALEYKVPLIDLNKKSQDLLQQLGPDKSKFLFNYLAPGENPHFPEGNEDNTHFNELGARRIAEIVLAEIKTLKLELAERIVKPRH